MNTPNRTTAQRDEGTLAGENPTYPIQRVPNVHFKFYITASWMNFQVSAPGEPGSCW